MPIFAITEFGINQGGTLKPRPMPVAQPPLSSNEFSNIRPLFMNDKACMKHNPNSRFLHGPGPTTYYNNDYKELFEFNKPLKPLTAEEKKQIEELIKALKKN